MKTYVDKKVLELKSIVKHKGKISDRAHEYAMSEGSVSNKRAARLAYTKGAEDQQEKDMQIAVELFCTRCDIRPYSMCDKNTCEFVKECKEIFMSID